MRFNQSKTNNSYTFFTCPHGLSLFSSIINFYEPEKEQTEKFVAEKRETAN